MSNINAEAQKHFNLKTEMKKTICLDYFLLLLALWCLQRQQQLHEAAGQLRYSAVWIEPRRHLSRIC